MKTIEPKKELTDLEKQVAWQKVLTRNQIALEGADKLIHTTEELLQTLRKQLNYVK